MTFTEQTMTFTEQIMTFTEQIMTLTEQTMTFTEQACLCLLKDDASRCIEVTTSKLSYSKYGMETRPSKRYDGQ